jgi:hypothetical protein
MHRPLVLLLLAVILLASYAGQAQTTEEPSGSPSPSPTIDPATEKKAFELLESASEQAVNLHSPSNRIRASCAIADLIWSHDEKRARALFEAAVTQLATRIGEIDFGENDAYQEISRVQQSRQELLMRIAAHDPELALTALRQTKLPTGNSKTDWNFQNEANLEFSIANMIVAKNPEAALKLIRASLARGVSWNAISFLARLNQKDKKAGQTLYQDIVEHLKQSDSSHDPELVNNTWNLLTSFQPPDADEATYKDLLTTALGFMASLDRETQQGISTAQNLYYQIERIMPLVEKYLPARASEMRNWSQTVERTLDPQTKMYQEMNKIAQNGTVDDMLALGNKYPPEFQNLLYQSAAWKAISSGDVARAHEIADMIHDPVQRRQVQDQIEAQAANAAKGDVKLDRARALIERARNLNRKIELIVQLANQLAGSGDNKAALQMLSDGKDLVAAAPQSGDQLSGQLRLAEAYEHFDVDQAFTILQPLTTKLNEFVAAAAVLDGVDFRYFKDGEWEMPGANNLGGFVNSFDRTLSALARHDFDRARKLADQMDRPEMRTMVEIDLAQSVLGKTPVGQSFNGRFNGIIIRN